MSALRASTSVARMMNEDVPIDSIMLDPARNVSRGCFVAPPTHPDVQKIIETIRSDKGAGKLLHCVGIFRIHPVARPCGENRQCCPPGASGEHTWAACYGFRRLVALRFVGRTTLIAEHSEYKDLTGATEAQLLYHNAVENMAKGKLTEAEEATVMAAMCNAWKISTTDLAKLLGEKDVTKVDTLVRIVTKLPADLFAAFRRNPSTPRRRILGRISMIDNECRLDNEKRDELMRAEWAAYEAWEASDEAQRAEAAKAEEERIRAAGANAPLVKRIRAGAGTESMRKTAKKWAGALDQARHICDPATKEWREMTEEERHYLRSIFGSMLSSQDPGETFR